LRTSTGVYVHIHAHARVRVRTRHTRARIRPGLVVEFTASCKLHGARLHRTPDSANIDTFNRSVCADTLFKCVRMCTAEKTCRRARQPGARNRSRASLLLCFRLLFSSFFLFPFFLCLFASGDTPDAARRRSLVCDPGSREATGVPLSCSAAVPTIFLDDGRIDRNLSSRPRYRDGALI